MRGAIAPPRCALLIAALLGACATTPPSPGASTLSANEIRELPSDEALDRVLQQIEGMIVFNQPRIVASDAPPPGPLNYLRLRTRAYPSDVRNVCRRDEIWIRLRPATNEAEATADTPMQAYGIETAPAFHVLRETAEEAARPIQIPHALTADEQQHLLTACEALPDNGVSFIAADAAFTARQGVEIFAAMRAEIDRDGARLACGFDESCRAALADIRAGRFSSCRMISTGPGGEQTWSFGVGSQFVEATIRRPALHVIEVVRVAAVPQLELTSAAEGP